MHPVLRNPKNYKPLILKILSLVIEQVSPYPKGPSILVEIGSARKHTSPLYNDPFLSHLCEETIDASHLVRTQTNWNLSRKKPLCMEINLVAIMVKRFSCFYLQVLFSTLISAYRITQPFELPMSNYSTVT